jgi:hypothetical protein
VKILGPSEVLADQSGADDDAVAGSPDYRRIGQDTATAPRANSTTGKTHLVTNVTEITLTTAGPKMLAVLHNGRRVKRFIGGVHYEKEIANNSSSPSAARSFESL